jgi:hypothetical protein
VFISAATDVDFWGWVDNLQELVESAHENKGTITYTPPGGDQVTFDLESIQVTGMPQNGVNLRNRLAEVDVSFECLPYGRLPEQAINLRPGNLVPNPSFESSLSGWTNGTSAWSGGTSAMTRVAYSTLSGNYALRQTGTKDATGTARSLEATSDYIPVLPNTSYTLTAKANVVDAGGSGLTINVLWYDSVPSYLSAAVSTASTGTGAKNLTVTGTSPGTAAFAVVTLRVSSSTSSDTVDAYWDAITLLPTNATSTVTIPGPIGDILVDDVPGQVPALAELTLTDGSTQTRNHVEVAVQHRYDPANAEPLLLNAVTDITGLAGSSNTRAGSLSTNVLRAAVTTSPLAVSVAESQPHKGKWKVRARLWATDPGMKVRLAWRAGNAPFVREKWVAVPGEDAWFEVDLGTVNVPTQPAPHTADFRIEARSATGLPTLDVDTMYLEPADNYTRLRGDTAQDIPTAGVIAADDFNKYAASPVNLAGLTPDFSTGNWAGAGDADDFQFTNPLSANNQAYRSAASDSADIQNGRIALCGTGVVAACSVTADIRLPAGPHVSKGFYGGVILRYVDTSNFLLANFENTTTGDSLQYVTLRKRVAGVTTTIGSFSATSGDFNATGAYATLRVDVDALGNVSVYAGPQGGAVNLFISVLADANLATAGALDDGRVGLWDHNTTASASATRRYDNFVATSLAGGATIANPAIHSTRAVTLTHNTALTTNSGGTGQGATPIREGRYLTLPPETRNSNRTRIAVKARRADVDEGFADTGTADTLTASLSVTPRVHLTSP